MAEILHREFVYLWYYFTLQLGQIFPYWVLGMVLGSAISVFAKGSIHALFGRLQTKRLGALGLIPASVLGIALPAVHVRHHPAGGLLFQTGDEGRPARGLYDELHPAQSPADYLQRRAGADGPCGSHPLLLFLRDCGRAAGALVLPGQVVF